MAMPDHAHPVPEQYRKHQSADEQQDQSVFEAALQTDKFFNITAVKSPYNRYKNRKRNKLLEESEARIQRSQRQMRAGLYALPDKINCPKLDKEEAIEKHNVDGAAFLVLQEPFLAEYMNKDSSPAIFDIIIKLRFLAEFDVFDSRLHHINEQTDSVSGYKQERNKIDPKQTVHKIIYPFRC